MFTRVDHVALGGTQATFGALGFSLLQHGKHFVAALENTHLCIVPGGEGILDIALAGEASIEVPYLHGVPGESVQPAVHPNGVYKLERVYIAVRDLRSAAARYAAALGVPVPTTERGTVIHAEMAPFVFAGAGVTLAQPLAPGVAADALARRGEGPFQALFRTRSMGAAAKWLADHGVPPPARGTRNTGEQAMLVPPEHACGSYIGFVGAA